MKRRWGDIDGWLTLTADAFITLVVIQSSLGELFGARLPWWRLTLPLLLGNIAAAWMARRRGYTALPFGPNTVFVLAFLVGVLRPLNQRWLEQGVGATERAVMALGLTNASLWIYALVLLGATHGLLAARPDLPRRALLVPLAAVCWVYLVTVPVLRLSAESYVMWIPAGLLVVLLWRRTPVGVPWVGALAAWAILGAVGGYESAWAVPTEAIEVGGVETLSWLLRGELWQQAMPVMVVIALANTFGLIENVAASAEVGDDYDARSALHISVAGTGLGAALTGMAPLTLYIGHPAYKRRGAGWLYVLLGSVTLVVAPMALPDDWLAVIPVPVLYGAVLYVGITVGRLPLAHLQSKREWVLAVVASAPVAASWAARQVSGEITGDIMALLGRGGGLISVAWALWWLGALRRGEQTALLALMAAATAGGLVHAEYGSVSGLVVMSLYVIAAGLTWYGGRRQ